jgi:hypothetical protein
MEAVNNWGPSNYALNVSSGFYANPNRSQASGFTHVEVRGTVRVYRVTTDADGRFEHTFQPLPGEAGVYGVAATFPGVPMPPAQDRFTLQGMRINPIGPVTVVEDSSVSGTTRLLNLSDLPLTGLTANVLSNTPGFRVTAQLETNRLAGDEDIALAFVVTAVTTESPGGIARVRITSAEGATGDLIIPLDLERLVPADASLMPTGLETAVTPQAMAALLTWLRGR